MEWEAVGFYIKVRTQYRNQAPMGVKDGPLPLTPILSDWKAALEIYGYPQDSWERVVEDALFLHNVITKQTKLKTRSPKDEDLEYVEIYDFIEDPGE